MMAAFSVLSVATAIYKPFAPVIIAELAQILCEVFIWRLAQCWSIGYFIGPILGGWAIDQPRALAHHSWLVAAIGTLRAGILQFWVEVKSQIILLLLLKIRHHSLDKLF